MISPLAKLLGHAVLALAVATASLPAADCCCAAAAAAEPAAEVEAPTAGCPRCRMGDRLSAKSDAFDSSGKGAAIGRHCQCSQQSVAAVAVGSEKRGGRQQGLAADVVQNPLLPTPVSTVPILRSGQDPPRDIPLQIAYCIWQI